ncbi:MAG: hypothetical protein JWN84_1001 [Nocardioides sp.]|nr:hypothetical protein [Nocardioides sp.]
MRRTPRLLASSTALAVTASLLLLVPGTATAADDRGSLEPTARSGDGITVVDGAASSRDFVRLGASAPAGRASTWPIGGGRATLTGTTVPAPTAAPAQQLVGARMAHYRVYGGVMEGVVSLAAAPDPADPATHALIVMRWGTISDSTCSSPEGGAIAFSNTDTDTVSNPVYAGDRITVKPTRLPAARTARWNCAFVDSRSLDGATLNDDLIGRASLFRQKPDLSIRVKGRELRARGFTRIPVIIKNSRDTVATAPRVRLTVIGRGVAVRYNPRVGTIKPGTTRRGAIFVKDTRRGIGYVTLKLRTKTLRLKLRVAVREVRR